MQTLTQPRSYLESGQAPSWFAFHVSLLISRLVSSCGQICAVAFANLSLLLNLPQLPYFERTTTMYLCQYGRHSRLHVTGPLGGLLICGISPEVVR